MLRRVAFLILSLIVFCGLGLLDTAAIAGRPTDITYTPLPSLTPDVIFSTMNSGWGDPKQWYDRRIQELDQLFRDRGVPASMAGIKQLMTGVDPDGKPITPHPRSDYLLSKLVTNPNLVVYRLAITMPDDYKILFRRGTITLYISTADSSTIPVSDSGVLCFQEQRGREPLCDSRRQVVEFSNNAFNTQEPDGTKKIVWVLVERRYLGAQVASIALDPGIVAPRQTALFR
ncbi:MAG: hypothetical protein WC465_00385 [Patescibacteria group bacterium]